MKPTATRVRPAFRSKSPETDTTYHIYIDAPDPRHEPGLWPAALLMDGDYFFDPAYCVIAPADPRSIAEAVAGLIARNIPRDYIRQRTLTRVERERARFIAFVQERIDRDGGGSGFAARFEDLIRSWEIKPWLTDIRGFAERLDAAVIEARRRR